jgi:hypothetical protein
MQKINRGGRPAVVIVIAAMALMFWVASCHKSSSSSAGRTLYDSVGGTVMVTDPSNFGQQVQQGYLTIRTIVDSALMIIQTDTLINGYFSIMVNEDTLHQAPTEYDKLSLNISNFLASAAGSKDYVYSGPSMAEAHDPGANPNIAAKVDSAAFNEFAYDIGRSAREYRLSAQLISQLGNLLYRYQGQVVQP